MGEVGGQTDVVHQVADADDAGPVHQAGLAWG